MLLVGCETVPEVIAQRRPAVEKTFGLIHALASRLEGAVATKVKPAPVVLERSGAAESNAMFIYAEDLQRPGDARPVHLRTLDSVPLLQCGALLSRQAYFADTLTRPMPSAVEGYLRACERLQYLLVIRELEFTPPQLSLETQKFAPGRYRAEVRAFDLRTGELLGGFPVTAQNEERVMLLDGDADHSKRLLGNLEGTVFTALREAARQAFPGSLPR